MTAVPGAGTHGLYLVDQIGIGSGLIGWTAWSRTRSREAGKSNQTFTNSRGSSTDLRFGLADQSGPSPRRW